MKIHRPIPQILIIKTSRLVGIYGIAAFILCLVGWYYILLDYRSFLEGAQPIDYILARLAAKAILWIVMLAPIFFLPFLYKSLKIAALGKQLSIDGVKRAILEDQKTLARFDEVEHLQLWTTYNKEDKKYRYSLITILGSGKEIVICNSNNGNEIIALADDVADIVKVKVIYKP